MARHSGLTALLAPEIPGFYVEPGILAATDGRKGMCGRLHFFCENSVITTIGRKGRHVLLWRICDVFPMAYRTLLKEVDG